MKLTAVIILIFLLLTQTFSKWILVWNFNLNKEYIAKNLCENRLRPQLHCNGHCQLAKRLAEEEKQNAANSNHLNKVKFQEVLFSNNFTLPTLPVFLQSAGKKFAYYLIRNYPAPVSSFFHPPAIV